MEDNGASAQPLNPDLAGYPTTEALVQGYRASSDEAKKWRDKAIQLEQQVSQRPEIPQRDPQGRFQRQESTDPVDRLNDYGVPADAIRQLIGAEIQQAFAPITRGFQARNQVVSSNPDYVKFEADVAQYINSDPQLSQSYPRMFDADPAAAMEYAFLKFGEQRRGAARPTSSSRAESSEAAIPSSRAGEGRRGESDDDLVQKAYDRYRETGSSRDASAYAKARLRGVIKDEFLNQ